MEIHLLTPQGDQLVVQVVDGQVIVPPAYISPAEISLQIPQSSSPP